MDIKKMIGNPKNMFPEPKRVIRWIGTAPTYPMRDSDRDGVPNILDCEPHNQNKQGFVHDIAKKGARTFLRGGARYKAERYIERKAEEAETSKQYRQEEKAEAKRVAHEQQLRYIHGKGQIKTDVALTAYERRARAGGFSGQLVSGLQSIGTKLIGTTTVRPRTTRTTRVIRTKPTYKYVKKGKHYVRKRVGTSRRRVVAAPAPKQEGYTMPNISEFKFEMPILFK